MRPNFKLIPNFIIPHLERATYGHHLMWEDKNKGSFKVSRIHQSSDLWSDDCIEVYKAWSQKKKLWKSDDTKKITKAKHRLITALRKNPVIEVLQKEPDYYRFRFIHPITSGTHPSTEDLKVKNKRALLDLESNKDYNDACLTTVVHDKQTIMKEMFITVINRQENNEATSFYNLPLPELENGGLTMPHTSAEVFPSMHNSDEDSASHSGTCCCDILLDSTLLHNERCIWHGIYT